MDRAKECQCIAQNMRRKMIQLADIAVDTMHWGGSFSSAEIFAVLFGEILHGIKEKKPFSDRDKFLLSKGHAALGVYTAMNAVGLLSDQLLMTYQQDGSDISELMEYNPALGFETSGGSLGINPSYAVGLALLAKRKKYGYHTYVEIGDGELDEGAVWEAIMSASQYQLDNITMIVDANTVQSDGFTRDIMSWENISQRFESFGWKVYSVDGHNCGELIEAFESATDGPKVIIANTVKGKGVSFFENNYLWHDRILKGKELEQAKEEIENNVGYE